MKIGWPKGNINLNGRGFSDDLAHSAGLSTFRKPRKSKFITRYIKKNWFKLSKKTEIIPTDPLFANKITIGEQEIQIKKQLTYLGEITTYNINDKHTW